MLSAFCRIQQPHSEPYPERTPTPAGGVRSRNTSLSRFRGAGGKMLGAYGFQNRPPSRREFCQIE